MKNVKNILFQFAIVIVLLFGITSCDGCKHESDPIVTADDVKEIIIPNDQAKELYDSYTVRREKVIRDYENAQDSLDTNDTNDDREQNEKEKNEKAASQQRMAQENDQGFKVVRYGFYDFEDLKKYMAFIEQEADKANVDISTLRFYFANYPDKDKFDNNNPIEEPRRNTFVVVPTVNTGNEEFAFFTANDKEDGLRKAFLLTEEFDENGKSFRGNNKEEASLAPTVSTLISAPFEYENKQSLSGNEWGLRPPK